MTRGDWVTGRLAAVGLALLLGCGSARSQTQPATVILVRHAERAAEPQDDPPISAEGQLRVRALLAVLRDAGVDVIYSTPRRRNLETAQPLADSFHAAVVQVPIEAGKIDAYARDIVARVRKDGGGRVSVVVGHSNTLGPVIKAFGGPNIEEIADERYDDLFVLVVQDGKTPKVIRTKFGAPWKR